MNSMTTLVGRDRRSRRMGTAFGRTGGPSLPLRGVR
jgi:hypothetical protein